MRRNSLPKRFGLRTLFFLLSLVCILLGLLVGRCTELRYLWLNDTEITDAELDHLCNLKNLRWLSLEGSEVTLAGASDLQRCLPAARLDSPIAGYRKVKWWK